MLSEVYYENRAPALLGGTIALQTLSTIIVALRFLSRRTAHIHFWWDDWTIVPALVRCFPYEILISGKLTYLSRTRSSIGASVPVHGTKSSTPASADTPNKQADPSPSNKSLYSSRQAAFPSQKPREKKSLFS